MRRLLLPAFLLFAAASLSLASGCATTKASGECEDYKPLAMCSEEFQYVCETTKGGCEQCSCVPKRHLRENPAIGPLGPFY